MPVLAAPTVTLKGPEMMPVMLEVPGVPSWLNVTLLFSVMLPLMVELPPVALPPRVAVPVLPERTVMLRPMLKPVPASRAAVLAPLTSPSRTGLVVLPKTLRVPEETLMPAIRAPDRMVVLPV